MNIIVRRLQYLIAAIALMISFAQAQTPVQVNPQLLPPYSLQVSDYYSGLLPKLQVLLLNRDINQPSIQVQLRMTIESQNCKLRTKDNAVTPTFTLTSGIPYYLTPQDLQSLFAPANLDFLGGYSEQAYTQTGRLPEGLYTFTIEANELYTGNLVSNKGFSMAWLTLADPPFLNTPSKAEGVTPATPQQIVFTWTPRHQASPTAAYLTTYIFSIVEDNSGGTNPEAAFASNPPLYVDSVLTTTYLYDAAKPQLIPGKNYAWHIQAVSKNGAQNLAMFRNNGISETFWFTYQNNCPVPNGITATVQGLRSTIEWLSNPVYLDYKVEYREKNNPDAQWFTINNTLPRVMLTDLKPSTQYEYRVGGSCREGAYTFNTLQSFTTGGTVVSMVPNCGDSTTFPAGSGSLQTLVAGDTIKAGSFTVNIGYVTGTGSFTGQGYVRVPWLMNAKVEVRFTNITVSLDRKLKTGVIETTYDPTESGIADIDEYIDIFQGGNAGSVITGDIAADTTLNVNIQWPGGIIATLLSGYNPTTGQGPVTITISPQGGGAPIIITADHLPTTIKDASGNVYQVNKDGTVTLVGKTGGDQLVKSANKKLLDADKALVEFIDYPTKEVYAFDAWNTAYKKSNTFSKEYERIPVTSYTGSASCIDNNSYYVSAKAIAPGVTDYIKARITITDPTIKADSVQFVSGKGIIFNKVLIDSNATSKTYEIAVVGGPGKDAQEIYALYSHVGSKTLNLGKLLVASYEMKEHNVFLIPINGATIKEDSVRNTFNKLYGSLNQKWNVFKKDNWNTSDWEEGVPDGKMDIKENNFFSRYTKEMKNLITLYTTQNSLPNNTIVIFVLKEASEVISNDLIMGDMPRAQRFGFVFTQNQYADSIGKVVAHEIGHGFYNLKHTEEYSGLQKGSFANTNVMDYPNGRSLAKYQWDLIADPALVFGLFDNYNNGLDIFPITESFGMSNPEFVSADQVTVPFLTPAEEVIYLPKDVINPVFAYGIYNFSRADAVPGVLTGFKVKDKTNNNTVTAFNESYDASGNFIGYKTTSGVLYQDAIGGITTTSGTSMPYEQAPNSPKFVSMGLVTNLGWNYFKVKVVDNLRIYNKRTQGEILATKNVATIGIRPFSDNNVLYWNKNKFVLPAQAPAIFAERYGINENSISWLTERNGHAPQCENQVGTSSYLPKVKLLQMQNYYRGIADRFGGFTQMYNDYHRILDLFGVISTAAPLSTSKYWENYLKQNTNNNGLWDKVLDGTDAERYAFYLRMIDEFKTYTVTVNNEKSIAFENLDASTDSRDANNILKLYSDDEVQNIGLQTRIGLLKVLSNFNPEPDAWLQLFTQINDPDEAPGVYGASIPQNIIRLIKYTPNADIKDLLEKLVSEKSFYRPTNSLFKWLDDFFTTGGIRNTVFLEAASNLYRKTAPVRSEDDILKLNLKNALSKRLITVDPSFWTNNPNYYEVNVDGTIELGTSKGCFDYYVLGNSTPAIITNPMGYVTLVFNDKSFGPYEKGRSYAMTAIDAMLVYRAITEKNLTQALMITLAAASAGASVPALTTAIASGNIVLIGFSTADLLSSSMFLVNEIRRDALSQTDAGKKYLNFWDKFLVFYGLSRGFTALSGLETKLAELKITATDAKGSLSGVTTISEAEKVKTTQYTTAIEQGNYSIMTDAPQIVNRIRNLGLTQLETKLSTLTEQARESFWGTFNNSTDADLIALNQDVRMVDAWEQTGKTTVSDLNAIINSAKVGDAYLGKLIKKVGQYEAYEYGEIFYRGMSEAHINRLKLTNQVPATGETFTSPNLDYIRNSSAQYGSNGGIIKFQVKPGTIDELKGIAVRNEENITNVMNDFFSNNPPPTASSLPSSWTTKKALFKTESYIIGPPPNNTYTQINIGLGKTRAYPGDPKSALDIFNENIISFEIIPF